MQLIQALLFDFDGTLIHSSDHSQQALYTKFKEHHIVLTQEDLLQCFGKKWDLAFQYLFLKYGIAPQDQAVLAKKVIDQYTYDIQNNEIKWVLGAKDFVLQCKHHFQIAIVSGAKREHILHTLTNVGLEHHFDLILGAQDYDHSKPHPEGYLKAMELLGSTPKTSIVFEDSEVGIESGKAAGCPVVGIAASSLFSQNLNLANIIIKDYTQITPEWLQKNNW
jgi:beta-phosphoglucomutase